MQHSTVDIAVVGAGLIGASAALGLAQQGFRVALIGEQDSVQQRSSGNWDLRVFALTQSSVDLLKSLHVWDALDAQRIAPVRQMCICGDPVNWANIAIPGRMSFDARDVNIHEHNQDENPLAWIVEQQHVQQTLDLALRFLPNVQRRMLKLSALHAQTDGYQLEFDDQTSLHARLVIGADGFNSFVRNQLGIEQTVHTYEHQAWVGHFRCERPHEGRAFQWFTEHGDVLALLPLGSLGHLSGSNSADSHDVSMVFSRADTAETLQNNNAKDWEQSVMNTSAFALGNMSSISEVRHFPLRRSLAKSWYAAHAILMGDAAHTMHPLAGQGLNVGWQDVSTWLDLLKQRTTENINDERLLRRYQRARLAPTVLMQQLTHSLSDVWSAKPKQVVQQTLQALPFSSALPNDAANVVAQGLATARNIGMSTLNQLPMLKRKLMHVAMQGSRFSKTPK